MLVENFPIDITNHKKIKLLESNTVEYSLDVDILTGHCIADYVGFAYWYTKAVELGYKPSEYITRNIDPNIKFELGKKLTVYIPDTLSFAIYSYDGLKLLDKIKQAKSIKDDPVRYNPILDKTFPRWQLNGWAVYDTAHSLVSAMKHESGIYVANLQAIMCQMLTLVELEYNYNALTSYIIAVDILKWAIKTELSDKTVNESVSNFLPTVEYYGRYNYSESYILQLEDVIGKITGEQLEGQTPKNAYPTKNKLIGSKLYEFDPTKSTIYQVDGLKSQYTNHKSKIVDELLYSK